MATIGQLEDVDIPEAGALHGERRQGGEAISTSTSCSQQQADPAITAHSWSPCQTRTIWYL